VKTKLSPAGLDRLVGLASAVAERLRCDPDQAVEALACAAERIGRGQTDKQDMSDYVVAVRRIRARRNSLLGSPVFRDPSWDMLLDLLAAHHRGEEVSAGAVCLGAGVPSTTALRHLDRLEANGLVRRERDRQDHRRMIITLEPDVVPRLEAIVAELQECARAA
jgi:DNA-binding transcriptional ArsR family regulator